MTKYNTYTLTNGLRIIHLPSPSPVVYCGYEVNAGTRNETAANEGMAHFCEHTTFKGTQHRSALQILNCLERVGGDLNAYTNKEDTVYYAAILREHIDRAVDLLTDIVFHSSYPQAEIDKEIEVICDEIESYNDTPSDLIYDEFENILFRGHPLGHNILGNAEQLRTYKSADAKAFTDQYYRPENTIFFAYGDIDFRRLVHLLEHATCDMKGKAYKVTATSSAVHAGDASMAHTSLNIPVSPAATTLLPTSYPHEPIIIGKGTHQSHVMIGNRAYSVHDDRRMALYLLNNILGGPGMNAKLNLSLRERCGLVYTVESTMVNYSDTGLWCVYFGCDPHDVKHCMRLVRKELDKMMEQQLTEAQLRAAKKQIKGQIAIACDNREQFALDFGKSFLHDNVEKDITHLMEKIDALTAVQLLQAAQDIFAPDKTVTLIYQ